MAYVAQIRNGESAVLDSFGFAGHIFLLIEEGTRQLLMAYRTEAEALRAQEDYRL